MDSLWAKLETYNESTHDTNSITVMDEHKELTTLRIEKHHHLRIGELYFFELIPVVFKEKDTFKVTSFSTVEDMNLSLEAKYDQLARFYQTDPEGISHLNRTLDQAVLSIKNPVILDIVEKIYNPLKEQFLLFPAATKFHHAYIGGLAHHTVSMLRLMEGFLTNYTFLNRDLLTAGIILHDLFKVEELSHYKDPYYTSKGKLIGHLVLGAQAIYHAAHELGYEDKEERLLLEHMVLTHHYYGNFGSPKKPNLPEALALHFIDNIDAKFVVLGEALDQIKPGEFTPNLQIIDRERFYKPKL
jgi:3'-5' exoribonuclease